MGCGNRGSELLWVKLLKAMMERGWYSVSAKVRLSSSRLRQNPFQEIAVRLAVWGGRLCDRDAYGGLLRGVEVCCNRFFRYYGWGRLYRVDAVYVDEGLWPEFFNLLGEARPLVVIDLSQLLDHVNESEYLSLRSQVAATLGVLRQYLWDNHLIVTGARPGVGQWLRLLLGRARIRVTSHTTAEFLEALGSPRAIVLDPSAPSSLGSDDVTAAEVFIVGGIVDKVPRPGATTAISRPLLSRGLAEPRKITLKGSIIGVPNRINAIVEILLRARYETCGDVDRAVAASMSPRDARLRAYVEISREAGRKRYVTWEFYCRLRSWLPLTPEEFLRAARMAHVEVKGRPGECSQQRPISSSQPAQR